MAGPPSCWGIANPETLIRLARWKDRLFIGCVAIASAVGAIVLYPAYALGVSMHFSPEPIYIFGVVVGGLLFGAGMAVSGYVPGSEWMALGEGRRDALYAVAGGILGAAFSSPASKGESTAASVTRPSARSTPRTKRRCPTPSPTCPKGG